MIVEERTTQPVLVAILTMLCFWAVQAIAPGPAAALFTWLAMGSLSDYGIFHFYDGARY